MRGENAQHHNCRGGRAISLLLAGEGSGEGRMRSGHLAVAIPFDAESFNEVYRG
jgi:hypothetical protein